ncbi:AAA family ATPase [Planomonospora parontospora]|uniref:helix-turn-helix transcriptional regulator n=1 Tax=Planomonospora parontospora TaxID=58119 RepID=UPI00361D5C57
MTAGGLHGREPEEAAIAGLLAGARAGASSSLVLRGEPGIGKTALLDHAAAAAGGMRLLRGTGIEFEAELPFSGLQLLVRPALGSLAALPGPQREALEAAFGLGPAAGAEPMLVGLAVLSLLAEHAGETGLLCLVDDAQWLDRASRDALVFAARRLHAEGVAMIFAARDGEGSFPFPGLPELRLSGLAPAAAAALLDRHPLAPAVRHRLLAEAGGNPLALLELPVAAALERTAARALGRSGHEAAAAAYERAARLSADPAAKAHREALAAEAALEAGDLGRARALGDRAARRLDGAPAVNARISHVRALADFWQGSYSTAHRSLLDGAELVRDTDPGRAAVLLVQAVHTSWYLGERQLAATLDRLAALPLDDADPLAPVGPYLAHLDRGRRERPPPLGDVLAAVRRRGRAPDQALTILCGAALALGQDADAYELATVLAAGHRARGGAGRLPTVLFFMAEGEIFTGRHLDALATATEALGLARDTGQRQWVSQFGSVLAHLDAARGEEEACRRNAEEALAGAAPGTASPGAPWAHWSLGLLDLGLGRAEAALTRFERLTREPMRHHICATRSTPDLVESAVRVGAPERAAEPLARFKRWAGSVRQPWADALVLRCRGLLAADDRAEACYTAALELHDREGRPLEYARTALLYGEWLRRARRKAEARGPLDDALEVFDRLGMRPWAERARGELTATGAPARGPEPAGGTAAGLTPQELQITRLAAQGLSNRDIAAQLFLSHRTVGYHLYKAYPKLGVASRSELREVADRLGV